MKFDIILFYILVFATILSLILGFVYILKFCYEKYISYINKYNETHDFSSAVIIDTHIGYSRFGTPVYFFVYEFSNGAIEQIQVSADEYYKK